MFIQPLAPCVTESILETFLTSNKIGISKSLIKDIRLFHNVMFLDDKIVSLWQKYYDSCNNDSNKDITDYANSQKNEKNNETTQNNKNKTNIIQTEDNTDNDKIDIFNRLFGNRTFEMSDVINHNLKSLYGHAYVEFNVESNEQLAQIMHKIAGQSFYGSNLHAYPRKSQIKTTKLSHENDNDNDNDNGKDKEENQHSSDDDEIKDGNISDMHSTDSNQQSDDNDEENEYNLNKNKHRKKNKQSNVIKMTNLHWSVIRTDIVKFFNDNWDNNNNNDFNNNMDDKNNIAFLNDDNKNNENNNENDIEKKTNEHSKHKKKKNKQKKNEENSKDNETHKKQNGYKNNEFNPMNIQRTKIFLHDNGIPCGVAAIEVMSHKKALLLIEQFQGKLLKNRKVELSLYENPS